LNLEQSEVVACDTRWMLDGPATAELSAERRLVDGVVAVAGVALLAVTWSLASRSAIPAWEVEVFRFFNDWPDWLQGPTWPIMQAGAVVAVPVVAAVGWLLWRRQQPTAAVMLGGLGAWALAKVVKELLERGRPAEYLADVNLRPAWDGLGFVSGHVATVFAIAVVVAPYLRRPWKIVLWALAGATGLLRMYTAAHLPLDVIGGAGLGMALGALANLTCRVWRPPRDRGAS
jgi:undecaprenyl-diphosphatase